MVERQQVLFNLLKIIIIKEFFLYLPELHLVNSFRQKPKGKIREKNPKGYSKFQNKLLNYLNNSQNSPEPSIQNVIGQENF